MEKQISVQELSLSLFDSFSPDFARASVGSSKVTNFLLNRYKRHGTGTKCLNPLEGIAIKSKLFCLRIRCLVVLDVSLIAMQPAQQSH